MVNFKTKLRKYGTSTFFVSVPKSVANTIGCGIDDEVLVDVTNVSPNETISYKCAQCNHINKFDGTKVPYCKACNSEVVTLVV